MKWEMLRIEDAPGVTTTRLKVHGGWVLKVSVYDYAGSHAVTSTMMFLPDPEHLWKIEEV